MATVMSEESHSHFSAADPPWFTLYEFLNVIGWMTWLSNWRPTGDLARFRYWTCQLLNLEEDWVITRNLSFGGIGGGGGIKKSARKNDCRTTKLSIVHAFDSYLLLSGTFVLFRLVFSLSLCFYIIVSFFQDFYSKVKSELEDIFWNLKFQKKCLIEWTQIIFELFTNESNWRNFDTNLLDE